MAEPGYITLKEAAVRGGYTDAATLRQAALRGTLRAVKMGRDWFTTEEWLTTYQEQRGRRTKELSE